MIIACPCCHGSGWIAVHDEHLVVIRRDICTHCMGQGEVTSELDVPDVPDVPIVLPKRRSEAS
jgi:hypothetical protein